MYFSFPLAALALAFPVYGHPNRKSQAIEERGETDLKPINIYDFERANGLHRRASEDFSHLDPTDQTQLIYGRPGKGGQALLANMTLYAPDGLQIVTMERFEPLTSAVDCKGDDGSMSLTFKSKEAFQHALKTWSFINEAKEKKFLLIANHDGCGPQDERQPYLITGIQEDAAKWTTHLTAQVAQWSEVGGTYDLDFGNTSPSNQPSANRPRGLIGALTGNFDENPSVTFPLNIGTPGKKTSIVSSQKFSLDCADCYIAGKFQIQGHLSVKSFHLKSFTIDGSPQGLNAKLLLDAKVTGSASIPFSKELFSAPIPDAGISISKIFKLGLVASYDIGGSVTFASSASISAGLQASVPDSAKLTVDVENPGSSSATGFDGGSVEPLFDLDAFSSSLTLAAYSQPKLSFGIDIIEVIHLDIALPLKLPEVDATLKAAYNESGLCSSDSGASKTGVQLSSTIGTELDLQLDADLGKDTKPTKSFTLFKKTLPLLDKCFPLSIPGLAPVGGQSSTVVSVSTTASLPTTLATTVTSIALTSIPAPTVVPIASGSGTAPLPSGTGSPSPGNGTTIRYRRDARRVHL